jgi:hypothetical protein
MTNFEIKRFDVVQSWANHKLSEQKSIIWDEKRLWEQLNRKELSDAQVLFKLLLKEVNTHNGKIQKKQTLLNNLRYKGFDTFRSKVFSGLSLPLRTIDKLIKENPDKDYYEIYKLLSK